MEAEREEMTDLDLISEFRRTLYAQGITLAAWVRTVGRDAAFLLTYQSCNRQLLGYNRLTPGLRALMEKYLGQ